MKYTMTQSSVFPILEISLNRGEEIRLERGAMVYHYGDISLEGKMNSNAGGLGGLLKAAGRAMVSGESMFITKVTGNTDDARIGIAPGTPGTVRELAIGAQQWRINDGAFLACDSAVEYTMQRQSVGKAIFGGTGGLFVMETRGVGSMLVNAYGDLIEFKLDGSKPFIADNVHVVAWSSELQYKIKVASGMFGFTSGEGLVNEFNGVGTVLIQTRNVQSLAQMVTPFISKGN